MTEEKYTGDLSFARARLSRRLLRGLLAPLVRWRPLEEPADGCTVVIAASRRILPVLRANLSLLRRQDLTGFREVVVVIDAAPGQVDPDLESSLRRAYPEIPLRVIRYDRRLATVARAADWGWIYSWASWSLGIAAATTRWVALHDLDALLIDRGVLRSRYEAARERSATYFGVRHYTGGGITEKDRLVTTFELVLDAEFVRRTFRPIALFNDVRRHEGRRVEFDTFLSAQSLAGTRWMEPIDERAMVHPSQMICQYVEHVNGRRVPRTTHNLFMIPYYYELGGDPAPMRSVIADLRSSGRAELFGRPVDATGLTREHVAWYRKQAERVELTLHGGMRTEVSEYFSAVECASAAEGRDRRVRRSVLETEGARRS